MINNFLGFFCISTVIFKIFDLLNDFNVIILMIEFIFFKCVIFLFKIYVVLIMKI